MQGKLIIDYNDCRVFLRFKEKVKKKKNRLLPWWSHGSLQGAQVGFLVEEIKSHMPCSTKGKKKNERNKFE